MPRRPLSARLRRVLAAPQLLAVAALSATAPTLPAQRPAAAIDTSVLARLTFRSIGPANMMRRTTDVEGVPGNPDIVYVGTGESNVRNSVSFGRGMYKSTDGGRSWRFLGLGDTRHIARVMVDPHDVRTVYVCAIGHKSGPNAERGVFVSRDAGETWSRSLFLDDRHGCADLDVDPVNPNIVYAVLWHFDRKQWTFTSGSDEGGIWRSTDAGRTWKKLGGGLPSLLGRVGIKVAPSQPATV